MRNDNCPDCSRLTSGDCGKHSGTHFEPTAKSIDQFKQELVKSLEEEYIPHPQMQDQIDFNYGIEKTIEIIKSK